MLVKPDSPPTENYPPVPSGTGAGRHYFNLALTALIVLVSGIVIGAGLTVLYFKHRFPRETGNPEQAARLVVQRIDGSVSLTPDERRKTEELVAKHMEEVSAIRQKYQNEAMRQLGDMNRGLTEIIGPERMHRCGNLMRYHHEHQSAPQSNNSSVRKEPGCCRRSHGTE